MSGSEVTCPRCGYTWRYKGKRMYVTCPNCRYQFKRGAVSTRRSGEVVFVLVREEKEEEIRRLLEELGIEAKESRGGWELEVPDELGRKLLEELEKRGLAYPARIA